MQNEYSKFLSFCHFCKRCHVRCQINWVQNFHLMLYLNSHFLLVKYWKQCRRLLLNPQFYQAPESEIMNQKEHYFHDLNLSYFYPSKQCHRSQLTTWQWTMYGKTKSRVYMSIKKTSKELSSLSNPSLGKWKSIFFIFVSYPLSFTT